MKMQFGWTRGGRSGASDSERVGENRLEHEPVGCFGQSETDARLYIDQLAGVVGHRKEIVFLILATIEVT